MAEGFGPTTPEEPRDESVGEANWKLAGWFVTFTRLLGVIWYDFELEALAKAMGPLVRRFPRLKTIKRVTEK